MTDELRGNKLPLSRGLESDYRPRRYLPLRKETLPSLTEASKGPDNRWAREGAMKCAFDSAQPGRARSRNGLFVQFGFPWAELPLGPRAGEGLPWVRAGWC